MIPEIEFQRALFTALSGLGLNVVDAAPQAVDGAATAAFPYVEIGALITSEWDDNIEEGRSILARIHTYSRSRGMIEARTIQNQVYDALHRTELTIAGQEFVLMMREMSDLARQADGSFHGVCEYRALIQTA
jgi:hypothetical protein